MMGLLFPLQKILDVALQRGLAEASSLFSQDVHEEHSDDQKRTAHQEQGQDHQGRAVRKVKELQHRVMIPVARAPP